MTIEFHSFEEVEDTLRSRYVDNAAGERWVVRDAVTTGKPGERCLTLQLEMSREDHASVREELDALLTTVRNKGYTVDELLQKELADSHLGVRVWLLIYESGPFSDVM